MFEHTEHKAFDFLNGTKDTYQAAELYRLF